MIRPDSVDRSLTSSRLCLELVNTAEWRASDHPQESLHSYADLVAWAQGIGLFTEGEKESLLRAAEEQPTAASRALHQAITLREVIYRIFAALVTGGNPPKPIWPN